MSRSESRRVRGPMALTAVLQTFLLISSLVLTPALVIAQDEQAAAESAQPAAPALALFIQPDPIKLQVGQTEPVTAWACDPATTLGPDADPAGLGCLKVEAEWSPRRGTRPPPPASGTPRTPPHP